MHRSLTHRGPTHRRPIPGRSIPAFLVALLLAAAANAGTVYVSLASDHTVGNVQLKTFLEVTNTSDMNRFFEVLFIPTFSDGTERDTASSFSPKVLGISPGRTQQFTNLTDGKATGMLEINADFLTPQLLFTARLEARVGGVLVDSSRIPIVTSKNLTPGGEIAFIQGMDRKAPLISSLGFINLAHKTSQCSIDLVDTAGAKLMDTVILQVAPLSHYHWDDVFLVIEQEKVADAHARVQCAEDFAVNSFLLNTEIGTIQRLLTSEANDSRLLKPGQQAPDPDPDPDPDPLGCPTGASCFELPGVFHQPKPGNEIRTYQMPLASGRSFSEIKIRLTVYHGGWHPNSDFIHNFFWLFRNKWQGNTFGYVNALGPNKNVFQNTTNVNLPAGITQKTKANVALQPFQTYIVDYSFNVRTRRMTTVLSRPNGSIVATISEPTTTSSIVTEGAGFEVWFGLHQEYLEVPTYGWTYEDFQIQFLP
jgi:hypothetical protein